MATLYRKYRPQKFEDLTGQEHIVQTIMNEICAGTPAHAYLFSGPRGVGKTTMARLLAKAVNCENRKKNSAEPCDSCISCTEITAGRNIDVIEMDAASHTGVENVRENIIENSQFRPTKSHYKVFIIDEAHMLSTSSFNALLKTLEEPPAHALFILATTELNKLPDTIISRCQRFNFKKIPIDLIVAKLKKISNEEGIKVDKEVLELIAVKSGGGLRDAESLLGQILSLNLKNVALEAVESILPLAQLESALNFIKNAIIGKSGEMIGAIHELSKNGTNPEIWAEDLLQVLRFALIIQTGFQPVETALLTKNQSSDLKHIAENSSATQLIAALDKTTQRGQETRSAIVPQLPLEILAVELVEIFHPHVAISNLPPTATAGHETPPEPLPTINQAKQPTPTKSAPQAVLVAVEAKKPTPIEVVEKRKINTLASFTIEQITPIWNKMIELVGESNPSLVFILKMATLEEIDGRTLKVNIPYSFHKDKVEEPKNKKIIYDAIETAGANGLNIQYSLKADNRETKIESQAQDLALQFGGEVVS